jgi:hypothetical protein
VADAGSAGNRLLYRMPADTLEKTVLVKEQPKQTTSEQPKAP